MNEKNSIIIGGNGENNHANKVKYRDKDDTFDNNNSIGNADNITINGIKRTSLSSKIYQTACSATLGAFITSFAVTPLDVVKVRMQSPQLPRPVSMIDGLIKIGRSEGLKYLWRGLVPTLLISMPSTILYFVGYETIKEKLMNIDANNRNGNSNNNGNNNNDTDKEKKWSGLSPVTSALIAGPIARIIAASTCSPIELIRTKMQSLSKGQGRAITQVKDALTKEGPKLLWRGLVPTLWRDVPFSGIYWCSLELIRKTIKKWRKNDNDIVIDLNSNRNKDKNKDNNHHYNNIKSSVNNGSSNGLDRVFESFISGAMAGIIASALTTPFDVAKTRRQVDLSNSAYNGSKPPSMWSELIKIAKNEGWSGLTRGIIPRMSKVAPACAIMIGSYEIGKLYFNR